MASHMRYDSAVACTLAMQRLPKMSLGHLASRQ